MKVKDGSEFILAQTRTTWPTKRYKALQNLKGLTQIALDLRVESRDPSANAVVELMVTPLYGSEYSCAGGQFFARGVCT